MTTQGLPDRNTDRDNPSARQSEQDASISREQVRLALRHLPAMQLGSFAVALLLAYSVRSVVSFERIVAWLLMMLLIVVLRIVYYVRFRRISGESFDGDRWKNVYLVMVCVSGIIWGLSSVLVFPAGHYQLISLFDLMIAGLSAATTVSHSSLRFAPAAWMSPAILSFAFRSFHEGGEADTIIGTLNLIYLVALVKLSFNNHDAITASITLRFENLHLLQEVRANADRFRSMFQNHNAVMLLIDPHTGEIVDANAAAERFYGYPADTLTHMRIGDINTLSLDDIRLIRQRTLNDNCHYYIVTQRLANGEVRTVEVHSSPINTGERVLFFSIIHDITMRLRMENDLRASEESYRNLFNSITDAIFILDQNGTMLDANRSAETMFGRPLEFFMGGTLERIGATGMNDPAGLTEAVRTAGNGESRTIDFWGMRSDGTPFPLEVRLMPAAYGDRKVVLCAAQDVSVRRRVEQEQLKTQKLEAIGILAGGIAHDFNNLLQGVFGYLAVAKRRMIGQPDKATLMLDKAEKALLLSVNLTTQLLTFSKGGDPVKTTTALGPVIETATRFALSGSKCGCRIEIAPDLKCVEADEGQISQVIQNIVMNAGQAMPAGGVVSVVARNASSDEAPEAVRGTGTWVEIRVVDSGVGIPKDNLHRIFEPYFTTKLTGSGLGLATSYSIIKGHGGVIDVHSAPGRGSIFSVWLPASEASAAPRSSRDTAAVLLPGRVLVMDDEEVVRDSVGEMLAALGQEADFATSGEETIGRYRSAARMGKPYAVVILDATVRNGMGGEETMQKLRELDPDVVAVVSSGYSDEALTANYAAHGFKAYLHKPFTFEGLQAVLGKLMQ